MRTIGAAPALPREEQGRLLDGLFPAASPLIYVDEVRSAILALKRKPDWRIASFFGDRMAEAVALAGITADLVVPVPQSAQRQRESGHNQAALLAERLAGSLGLPCREDLLLRGDHSLPQHKLDLKERLSNAADSYHAKESAALSGERVLLVDDVLTSGATACACAGALLRAGAGAVAVCTCATAPGSRDIASLRVILEEAHQPA